MFKNLSLFVVVALASLSLMSCSDSDGSGSLDEPKYEQDAARFTITSSGSPYSSIELSASGNYIITPTNYSARSTMSAFELSSVSKKDYSFLKGSKSVSSRALTEIVYGKYVKKGDNEYYLDGFGTVVVKTNGGNAVDLEITTNDGNNVVLGASRDRIYSSTEMTNKLCRTWKITKVHFVVWEDGVKLFDKNYNWNNLPADIDDDDVPLEVIFTKSGTYVVFYKDKTLAVSTWRWEDENAGVARYSWDYNHLNDPYASGVVNVSFKGNQMVITEEGVDEDERTLTEWFFTEVK